MKAIFLVTLVCCCVAVALSVADPSPPVIGSYTAVLAINGSTEYEQQYEVYSAVSQANLYYGTDGNGPTTMTILLRPQDQIQVTYDSTTCWTQCSNRLDCNNNTCSVPNGGVFSILDSSAVYTGPCDGGNKWNVTADDYNWVFCVTDDNVPLWYAFRPTYFIQVIKFSAQEPPASTFDVPSICPCMHNQLGKGAAAEAVDSIENMFRPF